VAYGCTAVNATAQSFSQRNRLALRFTGCAAQSVNKGVSGFGQTLRSGVNSLIQSNRLAINPRHGEIRRLSMTQEPSPAQNAGVLGLSDAVILNRNADIITNAATKRTNHMICLHKSFQGSQFPVPSFQFCAFNLKLGTGN
jgi:hypothetical protein